MKKYHRIILDLYGSAQECAPGEFIDHAMRLTRNVLRFDSGTAIRAQFSDTGQMAVQSMHAHNQPMEKLLDRRSFAHPDPTLAHAFRQRGQCVSASLTELDQHKYHDVIAYARRYEVEQTLVYISAAPLSQGLDVMALWRAHAKRAYSGADRALADLLMPHLFQARQITDRLCGGGRGGGTSLLLVSDSNGCLQFSDDDANRMLQAEWPEWTPPMLPAAFFRRLREAHTGNYIGRTLTANMQAQGRHLHIVLAKKTNRAKLSPAERSIAELAATGASYKAIAAELQLSPSTVRNQLHKIYEKLQISNKTALAATLDIAAA